MKTLRDITFVFIIIIFTSCNKKESRGRFNYPFIKSKISLTDEQLPAFNKITKEYTSKAKQAWIDNNGNVNRSAAKAAQKIIFAEQDAKIKAVLDENQYTIYFKEVNIERKGREKHHMNIIKEALNLDSLQNIEYDIENKAFFKTLRDSSAIYHGKAKLFEEYHAKFNVNRKNAFKKMMSEKQFKKYLELVDKYRIGKF